MEEYSPMCDVKPIVSQSGGKIIFEGFTDVVPHLKRSDIFVFPPLWRGLP